MWNRHSLTLFPGEDDTALVQSALVNATRIYAALSCLLFFTSCVNGDTHDIIAMPDRFVSLSDVDSTIQLDIRYQTSNNFVGRPIKGYRDLKCILTNEAAAALVRAQQQANAHGYSLKVYDCYRPQRAVADFAEWAKDTIATQMQHRYYPTVPKNELFARGYIAEKSGHSRGSTVDLTLVPIGSRQPDALPAGNQYDCRSQVSGRYPDNSIDMGTGYDCFDDLAHTGNPRISDVAKRNRSLLKSMLASVGFVNFDKEWWHYTLKDEPFPDTYFDFLIQ
jgi:zinc D-Ala-D-Ala dipeptidase